jgi:hypothetical protein
MSNQQTDEQRKIELEQCEPALLALQEEEYDKAYSILEPLAKEGNLTAMTDLGRLNARRLSSKSSFDGALLWLTKAAESGVASIYAEVGALFEDDSYQLSSEKKAFEAYQKGAKLGEPNCMFQYGRCFLIGLGTQQHTANALIWLGKAAHNDFPMACYWMGGIYLDGQYVEVDRVMAANCYERGAILGHAYSQNKLGIMYRDGIGREQNLEQAWNLFLLSADQGNEWGEYLLGLFYLDGIFVDQNYDIAHSYFSEAAKQELPEAWLELGAIYGKGLGVEADRALSIEFYEKAAELGDVLADFNLGVIFINADGVPRDIDRGIKHLVNAAELGHDEAKLVLLKLKEEHGFNVPTYVTVQ